MFKELSAVAEASFTQYSLQVEIFKVLQPWVLKLGSSFLEQALLFPSVTFLGFFTFYAKNENSNKPDEAEPRFNVLGMRTQTRIQIIDSRSLQVSLWAQPGR